MAEGPVSAEIAGALGAFFNGGDGPTHDALTGVFMRCGYASDDAFDPVERTPSKEKRIQAVVMAAVKRPQRARELIDGLLTALRLKNAFHPDAMAYDAERVRIAKAAFRRSGWDLSDDGVLTRLGAIDLSTGGREALDEQLARLHAAAEDPGQMLGTAKDLLEAVAKFVLEELGCPQDGDFAQLWYLARDRLGIHPKQVVQDGPAAAQIRTIVQSSWTIAEQVNALRNLQGTGHGRTLPTGVTAEMALLVVREACSIAEFTLATLDRALGR